MLIIKNGTVIDPKNGVFSRADVSAEGGTLRAVAYDIEPQITDNVIDAEGCYVVPGLIDHHTHLYPFALTGIPAEAVCFASGVTTAVDAGSMGCRNYESRRHFIPGLKLGVRFYLNVCSDGLDSLPVLEDVDPKNFEPERIRELFEAYPNELLGLKVRVSAPIVGPLGLEPVRAAVALADKLGVPVCVHPTNPPEDLGKLIDILRPGDCMTHMYMNQGPCLVKDGRVIEAAYRARKRGVIFEASDARLHFGFSTAVPAIREGFLPDFIGTDVTKLSMFLRPTSFSLAMQISKYSALGIPLEKVIACCTSAPAENMGIGDIAGSLTPGHPADIAVLRPVEKENLFGDRTFDRADLETITGHTLYMPVLTVKNGETVYRSLDF